MPRLPFVVSEALDEGEIVDVIVPEDTAHITRLQPLAVKHRTPRGAKALRPLTTMGTPGDGPVRDIDGFTVWRIRVANAGELTCTECGETSTDGKCYRCGKGFDAACTPMVPTVSYLREDEYELIKR